MIEDDDSPQRITFHLPPGATRMLAWAVLALALYLLTLMPMPAQYSALLVKLGNCTVGGYLGYWLDRVAMQNRIVDGSSDTRRITRAIIMAAVIIGVGLGS